MTDRLDVALAARGLARSRTHARALITDGHVRIDGVAALKPSLVVAPHQVIDVVGGDGWVSRGAEKLVTALDEFGIEVAGRLALDIGASTGGFTQVLRIRGADPVIAIDVGHGQLAAEVAADSGVISIERFNARELSAKRLAEASGIARRPQVIAADVSFISITMLLAQIAAVADADADVIVLVKPQFEVGRGGLSRGVVNDARRGRRAVRDALLAAEREQFGVLGIRRSPMTGEHGNTEFLVHLALRAGAAQPQWNEWLDEEGWAR